jgi:hypothetical protein
MGGQSNTQKLGYLTNTHYKSYANVSCLTCGRPILLQEHLIWTYEGVYKSFRTESITKYTLTTINTRREATQSVMAAKLTILTHKIVIQLHLVAESCTICSSRSISATNVYPLFVRTFHIHKLAKEDPGLQHKMSGEFNFGSNRSIMNSTLQIIQLNY